MTEERSFHCDHFETRITPNPETGKLGSELIEQGFELRDGKPVRVTRRTWKPLPPSKTISTHE